MSIYLNANTVFQCPLNPIVKFKICNVSNVKINNQNVICDDSQLILQTPPSPGQCSLNPLPPGGEPGPCLCPTISGHWNVGQHKLSVAKKFILTDGCWIMCSKGQMIKPVLSSYPNKVNDKMSSSSDSIYFSETINSKMTTNAKEFDENLNDKLVEKNFSEQSKPDDSKNVEANVVKEDTKKEKNEITKEDTKKDLSCNWETCEKRDSCDYYNASTTLPITDESKNARILGQNLKTKRLNVYFEDLKKIGDIRKAIKLKKEDNSLELSQSDFHKSIQSRQVDIDDDGTKHASYYYFCGTHHHIIPANQSFKQVSEIVRLANYFGYDINNENNGIVLPTMNKGYEHIEDEKKIRIAFEAMDHSGMQWHKGGHGGSYNDLRKEYDISTEKKFLSYAKRIQDDLGVIYDNWCGWLEEEQITCMDKEYEKLKKKFFSLINNKCKKIESDLRTSIYKTDSSKKYYISKYVYLFVHKVPTEIYQKIVKNKE